MKVSVIVPSYKPADYLWKCLDSLVAQTLDKHLFEVVIVLNGCNEPYYSLIKSYMQVHPETDIRLLQTDKGGVSNARNVGIDAAKGEYISFVDDDDWVTSDYLERMLEMAAPDVVVATNALLIDESDGTSKDGYFLTAAYERNAVLESISFFTARSFLSSACCKLIPRAVIADNRFDVTYKLGEDALFMFLVSKRIREIRLAGRDTFYSVRCRPASASRSPYPYMYRFKLGMRLTASYTRIYLSDMRHYDFLLYVSRIVATLRKLFYRHYE